MTRKISDLGVMKTITVEDVPGSILNSLHSLRVVDGDTRLTYHDAGSVYVVTIEGSELEPSLCASIFKNRDLRSIEATEEGSQVQLIFRK